MLDLEIADGVVEVFLHILNAMVHLLGRALDEHFHRAVREITHETRHLVASGNVTGGVAESHALHAPPEDNVFCRLIHAWSSVSC